MALYSRIIGMTHGWRLGGADPSHSEEGLQQLFDIAPEVFDTIKGLNLSLVVVGMSERCIETWRMIEHMVRATSRPDLMVRYSWLLGAGGSVDNITGMFITDDGKEFPANECISLGSEAAWYHLRQIDRTASGNKLIIGVKQYFACLGITSRSGSLYNILWEKRPRERRHVECLVREGKPRKRRGET